MLSIKKFIDGNIGVACRDKNQFKVILDEVYKHKEIGIGIDINTWNTYKEKTFLIIESGRLKYGNKGALNIDNIYDFNNTEFKNKGKKSNVR